MRRIGIAKLLNTPILAQLLRRILPERVRPIGYLTRLVRRRTGDIVRLGPFAGMRYIHRSIGSAYLPKLLGTYERELAPIIEEACALSPKFIVDLGSAEGYYAVGLALRNPQARILAFEQDEMGRLALEQMADLNGVGDRIEIRGFCEPAGLRAALKWPETESLSRLHPALLILCDVEGDEQQLLDPINVPALQTAYILVETHEFVRQGITDELRARFGPTHQVRLIWQTPRTRAEFPFRTLGTRLLPSAYLDWAVSEWRPAKMGWLWMKPRG